MNEESKQQGQAAGRVSVVMCTYNGEKYLKEQIDSILNQTYPIYELIVQDDCSTDGTLSVLQAYKTDARVKVFVNAHRGGYEANFNIAITRAHGDYIALSDQDDVWRADKIETLMKKIGDYTLLIHNSLAFTDDIKDATRRIYGSNINVHETYMLIKPCTVGHGFFLKKELLAKIKELTTIEPTVTYDVLIALLGSVCGKIGYLDEGLTYWRRHQGAATYSGKRESRKGIHGIVQAFVSLGNKKKRENTRRYFQLVSALEFKESAARQIADYMKNGTLWGILMACIVCLKNRTLFYDNAPFYKSLFIPLYFVRDPGTNIL